MTGQAAKEIKATLLGGYAGRLARERQQDRAISMALAEVPVGLALDTPLGPWLSSFGRWQPGFSLFTYAVSTIRTSSRPMSSPRARPGASRSGRSSPPAVWIRPF